MFRKKAKEATPLKPPELPTAIPPTKPKYDRPKILLIDMDESVQKLLERQGYNVAPGTFGTPYRVQKHAGYLPVIFKATLPEFHEKEIIILDLVPHEPTTEPPGEKLVPMEDLDLWAKCSDGVIDPRPRVMAMVQEKLDRILRNGGAFVVFADDRNKQDLVRARSDKFNNVFIESKDIPYDNWSFLSILSWLNITSDYGEEISVERPYSLLTQLLDRHLEGAL